MGQTLTHGIYLPDEGERNCYNGLAGNWTILDGAVGTIAEHTTQITGKAPAVHTHTKSDITDFPAYGNAAGTICEGNDSRLSDARTPVAHTHTKSDVTDLLNSNFIPSANNSYDLGSSSYQWNKIYSADVVHTSGNETITGVKTFSNSLSINGSSPRLQTKSTTYSSATSSGMTIGDIAFLNKDGGFSAWIVHQLRDDLTKRLCFRVYPHTSTTYRGFVFDDTCTLYPENTNSALGSSTYKWKTLNGVNPGALSLPGNSSGINTDNWDKTGASANSYTPAVDGWLVLRCKDVAGDYLFASWSGAVMRASVTGQGLITLPAAGLCLYIPVKAGTTVDCVVKATSNFNAYIYPCLGNV